jgi:hypothetical protein
MREWIALGMVFFASTSLAEDWVVVRRSPETGESSTPAGILVDITSIEILDTGIRRARVKVDFLSRRIAFESFGPKVLSFSIATDSYDCEKQLISEDLVEMHWVDGSVQTPGPPTNPTWRLVPVTARAAIPSFDFVCGWKPK